MRPWWKPLGPGRPRYAPCGRRWSSRRYSRSPEGDRRPADDAVRHLRRVRDAGGRRLRRDQEGQARRARGAGRRRQHRAGHRHDGQRDGLDRGGGHGPGHVHDLLRRDHRPERRIRHHRGHVRLRAAGRLGWRRRRPPQPAGRLVAGVRGRHHRGAAAVAAGPGQPAARRRRPAVGRTCRPGARGRRRTGDQSRCHERGQGPAAGRVHGRAVPPDRARHRRSGPRQHGAAARVELDAGQRRVRRPHRPDAELPAGPGAAARRRRPAHQHAGAAHRPDRRSGLRRARERPGQIGEASAASCPAATASRTHGSRPRRRCTRRRSRWWPARSRPTR